MSAPPAEDGWQRLDSRMLMVGPVTTLRQFAVPALIALVGIGSRDVGFSLALLPVILTGALVLGMLPWLTTRYRVTPTQLQVRTGLLQRAMLTAPLDRVRSVDLESSLLHRLLGLTKVQVGTGVDNTRIELNSLAVPRAHELQRRLLARSEPAPTAYDEAAGDATAPPPPPAEELARIDWSWLRFAPFSLGRLVVVAGLVGVLAQFGQDLPGRDRLEEAGQTLGALPLGPVLLGVVLVVLVGWVALSVAGYVVQWWNLRLVRDRGNLRLTAGLFTTRSTTVEESRVRGVALVEPLLLRVVDGAELSTLATGVGTGGVTKVLPPSPSEVARRVGHDVLGSPDALAVALLAHGPLARRRRHVQAQLRSLVSGVVLTVAALAFAWPAWLPAAGIGLLVLANAAAAEAAYANLGHRLTPDHLIAREATVQRHRTVLETDGIIGWVVRQSWFQRRQGLATLVATTAAGPERVTVIDVPLPTAVALADRATPGLLTEFLAR